MSLLTFNLELKTFSHHAYFIEGEKETAISEIETILVKGMGFSVKGNPDYAVLQYENFSVEDARNLREMHFGGALGDGVRVFVVYFDNATHVAQNALLKTLEEPNATSKFFFIAPSVNILLPTLKSRFEIVRSVKCSARRGLVEEQSDFPKVEKYLDMSLSEKMVFAKNTAEKITKEKIKKIEVLEYLKYVADDVRERVIEKKESGQKLANVLKTISYVSDSSSSVKMLLENLAINLH